MTSTTTTTTRRRQTTTTTIARAPITTTTAALVPVVEFATRAAVAEDRQRLRPDLLPGHPLLVAGIGIVGVAVPPAAEEGAHLHSMA